MADDVRIDEQAQLHKLTLTWDAPRLLTSGAVTSPIDDFARLYRMSTGVYGRGRYWRMDRPFPYARPYVARLEFGSPLGVEVIVPTLIVAGSVAKFGLPKLLDFVEQVLLMPSRVAAGREKNRLDESSARLKRIGVEEQLEHVDDAKRKAYLEQRAGIAEAESRVLRSAAEAAELLDEMDPELVAAVREFYGEGGIRVLADVARRAENGPARPRDVTTHPIQDPEQYPEPPKELPPPSG